ncbi:hypothetical protein LTR56_007035 [Elasticomyces elasticus]|nr:hypothetical protein LTR56_007035 [Elasticomyces elasticus]
MALVVFETPELLEAILLDLGAQDREGLKTLLLSQRVCKTFMATIAGSVKLQRTLFFQLEQMRDGERVTGFGNLRFNTLLFDPDHMSEAELDGPTFGPGKSVYHREAGSQSGQRTTMVGRVDPALPLLDL